MMRSHGLMLGMALLAGCAAVWEQQADVAPKPNGSLVAATAWAKVPQGGDAYGAGRHAALSLKAKLGAVEPQVVVLTECFAEKVDKAKAAKGVASVFGKERVVGIASYGFYTRDGVADREAVGLLALGGDGIAVRTAFVPKLNSVGLAQESEELKAALGDAGRKLAAQLQTLVYNEADYNQQTRLMVVLADTHSPKNQLLLDGIQSVVGTAFPITGGSANKNAGQNFIHWRGGLYADAAVALMIDGNIASAQNGAQAKDNDAVLATARKVASDLTVSYVNIHPSPLGLFLAFDCAGRKGKLDAIDDERKAVIEGLKEGKAFEVTTTVDEDGNSTETEKEVPYKDPRLAPSAYYAAGMNSPKSRRVVSPNFANAEIFGMWCAGEFGCPEDSLEHPVGRGWHIMGTVLGPRRVPAPIARTMPTSVVREIEP
ncbi:MAG: hypothetical protein FWG50_03580 [Kiritimatiellaeota bacterium]|nr:hypothetical protein [Kiritimatiellota bacterium]